MGGREFRQRPSVMFWRGAAICHVIVFVLLKLVAAVVI